MAIINALTENGPSSLVVSIQTHNRGEFYVAVAEKRQQQTLVFSRKDAAKKSLSQGEKQQPTPEIEKNKIAQVTARSGDQTAGHTGPIVEESDAF